MFRDVIAGITQHGQVLSVFVPRISGVVRFRSHLSFPSQFESRPLMNPVRSLLCLCALACSQVAFADGFPSDIAPLLAKHCSRCHGDKVREGNLSIRQLDPDFVNGDDADRWHEVLNRLNVGEMPPEDEPQPSAEELRVLTGWLTSELKQAAIARRTNGGQIVLRRLNRREYGNTMRDLFGVPLQFEKPLPPDGSSEDGFLNNGETLAMSPLHLDYYIRIARWAVEKALPTGPAPSRNAYRLELAGGKPNETPAKNGKKKPPQLKLVSSFLESHDGSTSRGKPPVSVSFGRRGDRGQVEARGALLTPGLRARGTGIPGRQTPNPSVVFRFQEFPTEGPVRIRVTAGTTEPDGDVLPQVRVFVGTLLDDGTEFAFLGPGKLVTHSSEEPGVYEFRGQLEDLPLPFRRRVSANRGDLNVMMIGVTNSVDAEVDRKQDPKLVVSRVDFEAPFYEQWPPATSRELFFDGTPEPGTEVTYAREILHRFMMRAWRRPVKATELDRVHSIWKQIWDEDVPKDSPESTEPVPDPGKPGLQVAYYNSTPEDASIETLAGMSIEASGIADRVSLNVPQRQKTEKYALQFSGILNVPNAGSWKLRLASDDGSRLYLDGRLLIDNDGNHGMQEKSGDIELDAGPHALVVNYFNSGGGFGLRLEWEGPGIERSDIDPQYLSHGGALPVARPPGATFESTVTAVLPAILASPSFLYLAETESSEKYLSDFELASRLSYFLWSTMPDDELLQLADRGELKQPDVLRSQVRRMLQDDRSREFVRNFTDQWLDLEAVQRVAINKDRYKDFWDETKLAMQDETRLFFAELLHHDLSALNLIDSEFTMLNDHLAEHYRIKGVAGPEFRRVALQAENQRGGLLTHGSLLYGGSDGKDSHPIRRGVWLLKRLLDDPPPDPPPNVPDLDQTDPKLSGLPLQKQLEVHRNNQACANCHRKIDPWGIAFEDYSAVGRWRGVNGQPGYREDAAKSTLPDGTEIRHLADLKAYLLEHRQSDLARALTKHLMTYALGRSLDFSDNDMIMSLTEGFQTSGFRIRWLIEEVVVSESFRSR